MSLATYGDLKASIAAWATRDDLTTAIPDFVAWAHQEICRRLRANFLLTTADVAVATELVSVPTDFLAIKRFYLDVSPRVTLQTTSPEAAEELIASYGAQVQYPSKVAIEGSNFHFAPLFSAATTGKLLYYAKPGTLSADADTNVVLDKYPYLYLYGALEALFRYLEDDNNADRYGSQFGALIESIKTEEAKDAMSGPIQAQPYAGGVV